MGCGTVNVIIKLTFDICSKMCNKSCYSGVENTSKQNCDAHI